MPSGVLAFVEQYTGAAALLVLSFVAGGIRLLTKDATLRQDTRGAVGPLIFALALRLVGRGYVTVWGESLVSNLLKAIALTGGALGAIRLGASIAFWAARRRGAATPKILRDVIDAVLFAIAFGVILKTTFDIELSSFIATSALVSVVLGLALQDTLGNLFAGLSLQAENPFVVGDWIQTPDYIGRIVEVAWRGVKIETRRLELITIPNNMLARGVIVNLSRQLDGPVCRDLFIHVDRGVPPNLVRAEIFGVLDGVALVRKTPPADVVLTDYRDNAMRFDLRYWVDRFEDARPADHAVMTGLWYRLRRANVPFAVPAHHLLHDSKAPRLVDPATRDIDGDVTTYSPPVQALATLRILEGLAPEVIGELAGHVRRLAYGQGEIIAREGGNDNKLYVVAEGKVGIDQEGNHVDLLPGEIFGEMSMLADEPHPATFRAITDVSLLVMDHAAVGAIFTASPEIAHRIAGVLAERKEFLEQAGPARRVKTASEVQEERGRVFARIRDLFARP